MHRHPRRAATALLAVVGLGLSVAPVTPAGAGPQTRPFRILVTNDDGVSADGIDALVNALRAVEGVQVTVIAPNEDMSGTGPTTTKGTLTAVATTTKSGVPATAVQGYPADSVVYALAQGGMAKRPDLVVSGVNQGANLAVITNGSGTVGAAKQAASRGIPAVAVSQDDPDDVTVDYSIGAAAAAAWLAEHRAALTPGSGRRPAVILENINVPTCVVGAIRGTVRTTTGTSGRGVTGATPDCTATSNAHRTDVEAFRNGYIAVAPLAIPKGPATSRSR
jgi:5'-nucleotidase